MCSAIAVERPTRRRRRSLTTSFSRWRSATRAGSASMHLGRCSKAVNDAFQFAQVLGVGGHGGFQGVEAMAQDRLIGSRLQRQQGLAAADEEGAVAKLQLQFARLEDLPILLPQDRQEDAVLEFFLDGTPIDVEIGGVGRRRAVLQHVVPPGVLARRRAHVVGNDVDDQAHAAAMEGLGQFAEPFGPAQIRVELPEIHHRVAVRTAACGFSGRGKDRRG